MPYYFQEQNYPLQRKKLAPYLVGHLFYFINTLIYQLYIIARLFSDTPTPA